MSNVATNENEEMALIHIAGFIIPLALAGLGAWMTSKSEVAMTWLAQHNFMVESDNVLIPLSGNIGLDLIQVIVILSIACTIGFGIARLKPRKEAITGRS